EVLRRLRTEPSSPELLSAQPRFVRPCSRHLQIDIAATPRPSVDHYVAIAQESSSPTAHGDDLFTDRQLSRILRRPGTGGVPARRTMGSSVSISERIHLPEPDPERSGEVQESSEGEQRVDRSSPWA